MKNQKYNDKAFSSGANLNHTVRIRETSEKLVPREVSVVHQKLDPHLKDMKKLSYKPFGRCIYCGATDALQREHIIPFGLSGPAVLPRASCRRCAEITGRFENEVLRGPLWAVRVYRRLHSRRKHKDAPQTEILRIKKGIEEQTIELPLSEYPILLSFPVFSAPAFLSRSGYEQGIRMKGFATVSFGVDPKKVLSKYGATEIVTTSNYKPIAFARMLAKIAYSYAVAEEVMASIDGDPFVVPAILGERDDVGKWVGTLDGPHKNYKDLLHLILLHKDTDRGLLIAEIQLFADSESPSYGVILGKLK